MAILTAIPLPRRRFLGAAGGAAIAAGLGDWRPLGALVRAPLDLLLRGGTVADGAGRPLFAADVGVRDGRIVEVGALPGADATRVLDVSGRVVAPGFVDLHGHTDLGLLVDHRADSKVRQGITTEVVGQDGSSVLPVSDAMRSARRDRYRERYGVDVDFAGWDELFRALDGHGHLAHFVTMVGSGTVTGALPGRVLRPGD